MYTSRRDFLRVSALGATGLLLPPVTGMASLLPVKDELITTGTKLLHSWGAALLALQVNQPAARGIHGESCVLPVLPFMAAAVMPFTRSFILPTIPNNSNMLLLPSGYMTGRKKW